jgi:tRNA A22 N-methylase
MGTFTLSTGLGMLAVGMAVITIAGMIALKVINTIEENKKEENENKRREKIYGK